jgi:hypothetical protein
MGACTSKNSEDRVNRNSNKNLTLLPANNNEK